MRWDFLRSKTPGSRSFCTLGLIGAFLFTIALADAPRLHEHFHKVLGAEHECAVTMFIHGNCDRLTTNAPSAVPATVTWTPVSIALRSESIADSLEFSLLEHAPPSPA